MQEANTLTDIIQDPKSHCQLWSWLDRIGLHANNDPGKKYDSYNAYLEPFIIS